MCSMCGATSACGSPTTGRFGPATRWGSEPSRSQPPWPGRCASRLTRNTQHKAADRAFLALIAVNVASSLSVLLGVYSAVAWVNLVSLVICDVIAVTLCIHALVQRHRRAQHALLLIAYGVHLVGGIPTTAVLTGFAHWNIDVTTLWQFQVLVFTALIASAVFVGMVLRYRQAEISKDRAIEHLAQSEQMLEDRIEQRTRELSLAQVWLKQALDSERDLRQEQRQFFHMISHEFRTPWQLWIVQRQRSKALRPQS